MLEVYTAFTILADFGNNS